eukprot:895774-Pleurochrysis_carterae.AAC.1
MLCAASGALALAVAFCSARQGGCCDSWPAASAKAVATAAATAALTAAVVVVVAVEQMGVPENA